MAVLHNLAEREQKEREGKMESEKGGGVHLVQEEVLAHLRSWTSKLVGRSAEESPKVFKKSRSYLEVLPQRHRNLWVDLAVTRGAVKGQTPTCTRPLCRGVHTLVGRQWRERECEVLCYLWSKHKPPVRGKTCSAYAGTFLCLLSLLPLHFSTHF